MRARYSHAQAIPRKVFRANYSRMSDTTRLCLWSGPRNVSTALMYSFRQRSDTRVLDEPLYGHYLRLTRAEQPGRDELLKTLDLDGARVVRDVIQGPCDRPVLFMKQMAHHLLGLDHEFLSATENVLLIRDPQQMLPSLVNQVKEPILRDTGLGMQSALLKDLRALGQDPPVLDAKKLLLDPDGVLRELCRRIDIPFEKAMLHWPAGPKPEDGSWAKDWYHNIHRSTGFMEYKEKTGPFPVKLKPLLDECKPHYDFLYENAIRAGTPG